MENTNVTSTPRNTRDSRELLDAIHQLAKQSGVSLRIVVDDKLDTFVRDQRSSPYYNLVSIMFAVILSFVGAWVGVIIPIRFVLPLMPPSTIMQDLQTNFQLTDPQKLALTAVVRHLSFRGDTTEPVMQFALAFLVFLYVAYLWLYFSRVFIYLPESQFGEALTFLLAFFLMASVTAMAFLWSYWPYFLSICTVVIALKSLWALLQLSRMEQGRTNHPFRLHLLGWAGMSALYSMILGGMGYIIKHSKDPNVSWVIMAIVAGWSLFLIISRFRKLEEGIKAQMRTYIDSGDYSEELVTSL